MGHAARRQMVKRTSKNLIQSIWIEYTSGACYAYYTCCKRDFAYANSERQ